MTDTSWLARPPAERAADLARIRDTVTTLSVTTFSAEEDLSVTVGAAGAVTAVQLTARALRRATGELSDVLIETIRVATRAAHEQLTERLSVITGRNGPTTAPDGALPPAPTWHAIEKSVPGQAGERSVLGGGVGARIEGMISGARAQLQRYEVLRASLSEMCEVGMSANGAASVTVRADGVIQLIDVDPRARRQGPEHVAAAIVEALRQARAQAARRTAERTQELLGAQLRVREMVESAIAEQSRKTEG